MAKAHTQGIKGEIKALIAAVLIAACKDVARLCANALYRDALC
jgi:hypothetical protein